MAFMKALSTTASALTATRFQIDVIAENIANATNTRTVNGEPYRRRNVVFSTATDSNKPNFAMALKKSRDVVNSNMGVKVSKVVEDQSPFKLSYDPYHPDADEFGYVRLPNVDNLREQLDLMAASRAYDANITAFNVTKSIMAKALEIGR